MKRQRNFLSRVSVFFMLLVFTLTTSAQEFNKTVFDEKNRQDILIGYCDRSGLMQGNFGMYYAEEYENYLFEPEVIDRLKIQTFEGITFHIVLGTWCGDSKEQVPRFIKLLDSLHYDVDEVTFIGVDRARTAGDISVEEFNIARVPTFIVYQYGEEIGRIIETPEVSLEEDLEKIILDNK